MSWQWLWQEVHAEWNFPVLTCRFQLSSSFHRACSHDTLLPKVKDKMNKQETCKVVCTHSLETSRVIFPLRALAYIVACSCTQLYVMISPKATANICVVCTDRWAYFQISVQQFYLFPSPQLLLPHTFFLKKAFSEIFQMRGVGHQCVHILIYQGYVLVYRGG